MSLFPDRPRTALLVIDVQVDVVARAIRRESVIANIAALVTHARLDHASVIWVQNWDNDLPMGSAGWQIVPELVPKMGEPRVDKHYRDAFEDTDLGETLSALDVGHLVVCGAQSEYCVISTCFGGFVRGYDVTLVGDAHTTESPCFPDELNRLWPHDAPGRIADVCSTIDVDFHKAMV